MKRIICFLAIIGVLCLSSCMSQPTILTEDDVSSPPSDGLTIRQTDMNNSEDSSNDSALPLQKGELILQRTSINDIVERFGAYESSELRYVSDPMDAAYIDFVYDGLIIELYSYDEEFSFLPHILDNYQIDHVYHLESDALTAADKNIIWHIQNISWHNQDIEGPRQIRIGDTYQSVIEKFLDLSEQYPEPPKPPDNWDYSKANILKCFYLPQNIIIDYNPGIDENGHQTPESYSYGIHAIWDKEPASSDHAFNIQADSVIEYHVSIDFWYDEERLLFYIKDGKVIHIEQSATGPQT